MKYRVLFIGGKLHGQMRVLQALPQSIWEFPPEGPRVVWERSEPSDWVPPPDPLLRYELTKAPSDYLRGWLHAYVLENMPKAEVDTYLKELFAWAAGKEVIHE